MTTKIKAGDQVGDVIRKGSVQLASLGIEAAKTGGQATMQALEQIINYKPPEAVFGAAPSLATMRALNGRKTIFRGAWFWYYYRVYYPYVFPPLFLIFMIVALAGWNTVEGHLVLGSVLSLISSVSVIVSYIMIQPWQKHPSKLVLYRALTSCVFSLNLLFEAIQTDSGSCRNYATVTEVTLLAGECWLTTIALDLVYSLTNPFSSYKENMRRYQIMIWFFTSLISFVFFFDTNCQGNFEKGLCWLKIQGTSSPCLWGYYLFWIVCMYIYQASAAIFAYNRLSRGLPATFEVRKRCAQETFKCLLVYALYLTVLFFMFAIIAGSHSDTNPQAGTSMGNFALFFLFIISNRGTVDGVVWFMLHDFARDDPPSKTASLELAREREDEERGDGVDDEDDDEYDVVGGGAWSKSGGASPGSPGSVEGRSRSLSLPGDVKQKMKDVAKDAKKTFQELADLAISEIDEADLSPQVNMALRQQIVTYVSRGVKDSIERKNIKRPESYDLKYYLDNFFVDVFMNFETEDPALTPGLEVFEFVMDEHPFKAFAPSLFKELRESEGISDEKYLQVLSSDAKERLSEGASGAFMIFCGGGEFIVKTIRAREARVLHQSLPAYYNYLKKNKDSFLCRFLGSYSLKMYAQTFYFVVMLNCFDPKAEINERFDIKGSWVGRSAEKQKGGKRTVCRHCNTYFVPDKKEKCEVIVGPHEANVVLKDNDLRVKMSLQPTEYERVMRMLKKDSDLLGKLGVMDYSLLVGIKKKRFDVADQVGEQTVDATDARSNNSTFYASSITGPAVYHLGIVDFLQDWTRKKKIERAFKTYVTRKDPDGLSVMHPRHYKERFQSCMLQIFETSDGSKMPSRSSSVQNLAASAAVFNPLQQQIETTLGATPLKKKASKKKKNSADDDDEAEISLLIPGAIQFHAATNTTAQLDESVDEFAEYLDNTAVLDTTAQHAQQQPAAALTKPSYDDDSMDML